MKQSSDILSDMISLSSKILKGHNNGKKPSFMYIIKEVFRYEDLMEYHGISSDDINLVQSLILAYVLYQLIPDPKYILEMVREIDSDTKFRLIKIVGIKGQTEEEKNIVLNKDPIALWVYKNIPSDFKTHLLEVQNQHLNRRLLEQ